MKKMDTAKRKITTALAVAAVMASATVFSPVPAKADPTLAAVLGGVALAGVVLHSGYFSPDNHPNYGYHPGYGYPYGRYGYRHPYGGYGYYGYPYGGYGYGYPYGAVYGAPVVYSGSPVVYSTAGGYIYQ